MKLAKKHTSYTEKTLNNWVPFYTYLTQGSEGISDILDANDLLVEHSLKDPISYAERLRRAEELPITQLYGYKRDPTRVPGFKRETEVPSYPEYTGKVLFTPKRKKNRKKLLR
jgi:hypothetical protein